MNPDIQELHAAVFGCQETREPGLKKQVAGINLELNGNGELGLKQKVAVLWRLHVWVLCTLSAAAGSLATIIMRKVLSL